MAGITAGGGMWLWGQVRRVSCRCPAPRAQEQGEAGEAPTRTSTANEVKASPYSTSIAPIPHPTRPPAG